MSDVRLAAELAREVADYVQSSEDWDNEEYDWMALEHLADYYRLQVDNNEEMFAAELQEHVGQYYVTDAHMTLVQMPEDRDVASYIVRDIVRLYREWAFLNGYRNDNPDDPTVDLDGYRDHHTRELLEDMNEKIQNRDASVQDVFVALKLAHTAFNRSKESGHHFATVDEAFGLLDEVGSVVANIVDRAEANENMPFDYNKVGGTLDFAYNELHHKGLEEVAKKDLAKSIVEGETTAEEFLENY